MKSWIPIDKDFRYYLPKDRPYTRLEAMVSYTLDRDEDNEITERGYAKLWQWSRSKVKKFIEEVKEPQKGHSWTTFGPPVIFINKDLWEKKDQKGATKEPQKSRTVNTNTKPNTNNKLLYGEFVYLTIEEYNKLVSRDGKEFTHACIERLDNYIGSKGVKYQSHYRTILNWVRDAEIEKGDWHVTDDINKGETEIPAADSLGRIRDTAALLREDSKGKAK